MGQGNIWDEIKQTEQRYRYSLYDSCDFFESLKFFPNWKKSFFRTPFHLRVVTKKNNLYKNVFKEHCALQMMVCMLLCPSSFVSHSVGYSQLGCWLPRACTRPALPCVGLANPLTRAAECPVWQRSASVKYLTWPRSRLLGIVPSALKSVFFFQPKMELILTGRRK